MNKIDLFVNFVKSKDGIGNKTNLTNLAISEFNLTRDRSVFYCSSFAVRFSQSSRGGFSNTILSLSHLQKYDEIPFIVCLVTENENKLYLANSTLLSKISHSSHALTVNNIKGSFNGSDIQKILAGVENNRNNLQKLFAIHSAIGFVGNLERLVETTTNICPTGSKFNIGDSEKINIKESIYRAEKFCKSSEFKILKSELDSKVSKYKNEIMVASHIENVNIRGRLIEYLIAGDDEVLKQKLVSELTEEYNSLPAIKTMNALGDYLKVFDGYHTETDIKTKIVVLNSNPKAYNIDKFLEFHNRDNTVFLFYFIGIDSNKVFSKILLSVFQEDLISSTIVLRHWAGRNSRGVTQFDGQTIHRLLDNPSDKINSKKALEFVCSLYEL